MQNIHRQSGMSLVELLVTMMILGVISTAIYNIFRVHNLMAAKQDETTLMQQELLSMMIIMADDLRMCGYSPSDGTFGLNATQTNATAFYCTSDSNGNGLLDVNSTEHLAYRWNANSIESYDPVNDFWIPAASNISALTFTYFDSDGNPNATTDNTRIVEFTITATASPARANMPIADRTMTTRVYCRNLGI